MLENDIFKDVNFLNFIFEIIDYFKLPTNLCSDYAFVNEIVKRILESRDSSSNYIDTSINQLEIIQNLKLIANELTNQKFDKFLIKRKNENE